MSAQSDVSRTAPKPWPVSPEDLHELIRCRAEEIYFRSGRIPGRDKENWVQAEEEILRESANNAPRRHLIAVNVQGVQYIGEYSPESADGYMPGEFKARDPVSVCLEGEKMWVKRRNGKELEAKIVKRIR